MNLHLVDEIQLLSDCRTHQHRAQWLLTCPLMVLAKYEMTIRNRLQIAGFHFGVEYLEEEVACARVPRKDGFTDLNVHLVPMREIASGAQSYP
ncbi:hypothetical protein [Agrobacterium vitis]|uniref:hypothetical protein n=1 Tax=Agrobacterium vitis TaxID=373 RepID=UPI0012E8BA54|nr:hypothetical protein [Agrobacterium vitis]MVA33639.1 hypothetical protein [Agrobacterium vitis]